MTTTIDDNTTSVERFNVPTHPTEETAGQTLERVLAERGCTPVQTGSPIGNRILVRINGELQQFTTTQSGLGNALGAKHGLVNPAMACTPTATGVDEAQSRLVVVIADPEDIHRDNRPDTVNVVLVSFDGDWSPWPSEQPTSAMDWVELREFLQIRVAQTIERGEKLLVGPLDWPDGDRPSVSVSADYSDDFDSGSAFYLDAWQGSTAPDDPEQGDELDDEDSVPVAQFQRRFLPAVADAICDQIKTWNLSPLNVGTISWPHRRHFVAIPA